MIAKHFKYNDEFINSDYWRLQKLQEMGLLNEEIEEFLASYTGKAKSEIKKALNEIGKGNFNFNQLNGAYKDGTLKINPNILIKNNTIQEIISNAHNETSNHFIELSKKIENSTREAYLGIIESAYLKTTTGTHSYQEAIRESINDLSNKGITTLTYRIEDNNENLTGIRNYDIESTIRRQILTNTRKLSNDINKEICEELNSEYIKISEHDACRPSHFPWQGTIIKYKDLVSVTNYGDVAGLGGINCKHYFEPYFGKARGDELKEVSEKEAEEKYNLSQKQRYLERGVRKWRRKEEMYKASGDVEAYKKSKEKVKEQRLRTREFTEENNLNRDYTREYVSENNKLFEDNIIERDFKNINNKEETLMIYSMENYERLYKGTNHSKDSVGDLKSLMILMTSKKNSIVAVHNHPSNSSFSFTDICTFNKFKSINMIVVKTDDYLYYLEKNNINKIKELEKLERKYNNDCGALVKKYGKDIENRHRVNKIFCERIG